MSFWVVLRYWTVVNQFWDPYSVGISSWWAHLIDWIVLSLHFFACNISFRFKNSIWAVPRGCKETLPRAFRRAEELSSIEAGHCHFMRFLQCLGCGAWLMVCGPSSITSSRLARESHVTSMRPRRSHTIWHPKEK